MTHLRPMAPAAQPTFAAAQKSGLLKSLGKAALLVGAVALPLAGCQSIPADYFKRQPAPLGLSISAARLQDVFIDGSLLPQSYDSIVTFKDGRRANVTVGLRVSPKDAEQDVKELIEKAAKKAALQFNSTDSKYPAKLIFNLLDLGAYNDSSIPRLVVQLHDAGVQSAVLEYVAVE